MEVLKEYMPAGNIAEINNFIDAHYPYQQAKFVFPNQDPVFRDFFVKAAPVEIQKFIHPDTYIVLRMIKPGGATHAYDFHFDNYEHTVLVPLMNSDAHFNGDLLVRENLRTTPTNIVVQILQKLLFQNTLALALFRKWGREEKFFTRIRTKPGDAFAFDGARSLHGNMPVEEGERRTVLIHNKRLLKGSKVMERIEQYSQYRKQDAK